ncbi:hypothetical protein JMJ56_22475 [Belnapia sp. T18]|uniref:Uncharacterized protein n=1 Tax=Belnapia arida TaxID=2804533 RepID=A0ABS1U9J2_9PROT|nr:hypothetical protein [Belnapia arida]MBL6080785.1 hypothetical protein [Belnapia arida]
MKLRNALAAALLLTATGALPALADDDAGRPRILAQAASQRDRAPHFDPTRGDGPQPHNPSATSNHSGGAAAHFDAPRGDGPQPHRPDGVATQSPSGAPAHFDATQGGGQQPHAPGRGAPQPGR